ncbi:hypothetical protein ACG04R_11115 [Roseateles sp. BYS78W]|uniref:Uncharacterized protein n=1 Tax=Pelomonas candidula TaxID=3299025 RepID=A0ABW7HBB7_9BURK
MNNNETSALRAAGAAIVAAGLLTACFGGGDGVNLPAPPMAATAVPDSALVSSTAYESFTDTTASSSTETAEPLAADNISTPPSSETDEPASVS